MQPKEDDNQKNINFYLRMKFILTNSNSIPTNTAQHLRIPKYFRHDFYSNALSNF